MDDEEAEDEKFIRETFLNRPKPARPLTPHEQEAFLRDIRDREKNTELCVCAPAYNLSPDEQNEGIGPCVDCGRDLQIGTLPNVPAICLRCVIIRSRAASVKPS